MQHAVVHTEVCQPDWMAFVSLTGSLTSSIRLSAWAPSPAFLSALCFRYQRRGYQPYRVYPTSYARRPGLPSSASQRPGMAAVVRPCDGRRVAQGCMESMAWCDHAG